VSIAARLTAFVLVTAALMNAGCAKTSSSLVRGMTAPNPTGCYVEVFDHEQLRGSGDFINGPMRYGTLDSLPNGARWNRRIRSIEVGRGAIATLWTNPNRSGKSMDLSGEARYPALPPEFAGRVESIDVRCEQDLPTTGYLVTQGLN
jgi:hypothetical protein